MKLFRRIVALLMVMIICFSFAGCENIGNLIDSFGGDNETEDLGDGDEDGRTRKPKVTPDQGNENTGNASKVVLGEYTKELEFLDDDIGNILCEAVNSYIDASFLVEKLGHIDMASLKTPETMQLLEKAIESWDKVVTLSALEDYFTGIEIEKAEKAAEMAKESGVLEFSPLVRKPARIATLSTGNNSEAVEWAKAITQKYDSIQGNHKLKELASFMGTDAKTAYNTLCIAQDILKGEYALEEGNAEEWLAILKATKISCKVGVYLCATAITCGATGAVAAAPTLTTGQVTGMVINGVDCLLTVGAEGANIILGEDSKTAKCIGTVADYYAKANWIYGFSKFNSMQYAGQKLAFIGKTIDNVNSGVSYFFNVDPLGNGGQLVTKVVDSWSEDYTEAVIEDLRLGGAYRNEDTATTVDEFIADTESRMNYDELVFNLKLDNVKEIKEDFEKTCNDITPVKVTDKGVSFMSDSYHGYCFRNADGYLDGERVQYAYDKEKGIDYIYEKSIYEGGVAVEEIFYEPDGLITKHIYYDAFAGLWVDEVYEEKTVEDDINPTIRGNLRYRRHFDGKKPDKKTVDEHKEDGCYIIEGGYSKTVWYESLNDSLVKSVSEYRDGVEITNLEYMTDKKTGEHYLANSVITESDGSKHVKRYDTLGLAFTAEISPDGTEVYVSYYEDGRESGSGVKYPDGTSDTEEYRYLEDSKGSYKETLYYTDGRYIGSTKAYDDPTVEFEE